MVLLTMTLAAAPAGAEPVAYQFDPSHSFVTFEVLHFDTSTIRGRFGPLSGDAMLDRSARKGRVQVVIDTASVSTGLPVLDKLLRRDDLLAIKDHPQAFFVAEQFEFDPDGAVTALTGEFTLHGRSQSLRLRALRFRCYTSLLFAREVCGGDFETEISRGAFGVTNSLAFVADTVRLKIQVEAVRQ